MARRTRGRRYFGSLRTLPSGRVQARYVGPDGRSYTAKSAGGVPTFDTEQDADAALSEVQTAIRLGTWVSPTAAPPVATASGPVTFAEFAQDWIAARLVRGQPLASRTRAEYQRMTTNRLAVFGPVPVGAITEEMVRDWFRANASVPTERARCYSMLNSMMTTAARKKLIGANPCQIDGGATTRAKKKIRVLSRDEVTAILDAMPDHLAALVAVTYGAALRAGEVFGLQRRDVNLAEGLISVERSVARLKGGPETKNPKTEQWRVVPVGPEVALALALHLDRYVGPAKTAWLFSGRDGGPLPYSTLMRSWRPAAAAAGRPDATLHLLRHSRATEFARRPGVTTRDAATLLGHADLRTAFRYQHSGTERLAALVAAENV